MIGSALEAAEVYHQLGWGPIPIEGPTPLDPGPGFVPNTGKKPVGRWKGWQKSRADERALGRLFRGGRNVGLVLGPVSDGLADVDLDCPEAIELAPLFLPPTPMRHGRRTAPDSHWWYRVPDTEDARVSRELAGTLVELRGGGGHQTVAPPSLHWTGERLSWSGPLEPTEVRWAELAAAVDRLALASALVRAGWTHDEAVAFAQHPGRDWAEAPEEVLEGARRWGMAPAPVPARAPGARPSRGSPGTTTAPFTELVLAAVSVASVLARHGLEPPDSRGRRVCPLHEDAENPTSFWVEGSRYFCHSCGAAGDSIQLHAELAGLGRVEARSALAELFGIPDPLADRDSEEEDDEAPPPEAAPVFQHQLPVGLPSAEIVRKTWRGVFAGRTRALLDQRGTGAGKTHSLVDALFQELPTSGGRVFLAANRHDQHDEETLPMIAEAAERHGQQLPVVKRERFRCPLEDSAFPDEAAKGAANTDLWGALVGNGWSPAGKVCGPCPRAFDDVACSYWAARKKADEARVVLVQHAHVPYLGAKKGDVVVFDEDPTPSMAPRVELTQLRVDAFARGLARGREALATMAATASKKKKTLAETIMAAEGALEVAEALVPVLCGEGLPARGWGRLQVPHGLERDLQLAGTEFEELLNPKLRAHLERALADVKTPNLLPVVLEIVQRYVNGDRGLPARRSANGILLTLRHGLPDGVGVAVLDATASQELLEQVLGRTFDGRLQGAEPVRRGELVQLTDSPRGRARFAGPRGRARLEADARVMANVVSRHARFKRPTARLRIGLIAHAEHEQGLASALRAALRPRRNWLPAPAVTTTHWGAQRGSNGLGDVDVLFVHGAPVVPEEEVERCALVLDPELQLEGLGGGMRWASIGYRGGVGAVPRHAVPAWERAWRAVVEAELRQGIGRGDRGQGHPPGGTWVFTSVPFSSAEPVRLTRPDREMLTDELDRLFFKGVDALDQEDYLGRERLAKKLRISLKRAQNLIDLVDEVIGRCSAREFAVRSGGGCTLRDSAHVTDASPNPSQATLSAGVATVAPDPAPYIYKGEGQVGSQLLADARDLLDLTVGAFSEVLAIPEGTLKCYLSGQREPPTRVVQLAEWLVDQRARQRARPPPAA